MLKPHIYQIVQVNEDATRDLSQDSNVIFSKSLYQFVANVERLQIPVG